MTIEMTGSRPDISPVAPARSDLAGIVVPRHPLTHRLRGWLLWLALIGLLAWSWTPAEMFRVSALFTDWRNMAEFGRAFLHPNFHDWDICAGHVLVVEAQLSAPVTDGGVMVSAYSGVRPTYEQALGAHRSAAGSGASPTTASTGGIPVETGTVSRRPSISTVRPSTASAWP